MKSKNKKKQNKMDKKVIQSKHSQIWIETAIYTLIGLTVIGVLIAIAQPMLDKARDAGIIQQTMDAMNQIDGKISEISQAPGSIAVIDLKIAKGIFTINSSNDSLQYVIIDTPKLYSQLDLEIKEGNIYKKTIKHGTKYNVYLKRYYTDLNISYKGNTDTAKSIQAASNSYRLSITNLGKPNVDDKTSIDFSLLS